MAQPTCFISYSWEGKRHQNWVSRLAQALALNGVLVHVDFWDTYPGMDISQYMESSVRDSTHVLIICTTKYAARADGREGGVGAETSLITGQTFTDASTKKKFVPILRQGKPGTALPTYLRSKLFINFRGRAFRDPLVQLLRHVFDERELKPPKIGERPTFPNVVLPKGVSTTTRVKKPKKPVVRKKQKELQRLMVSGLGKRTDRQKREAISRAARDLPELRRPEIHRSTVKRAAKKRTQKKRAPKK